LRVELQDLVVEAQGDVVPAFGGRAVGLRQQARDLRRRLLGA
jgi:hypothetical protein